MPTLIAAFLLSHFEASSGWWVAFGIIVTIKLLCTLGELK